MEDGEAGLAAPSHPSRAGAHYAHLSSGGFRKNGKNTSFGVRSEFKLQLRHRLALTLSGHFIFLSLSFPTCKMGSMYHLFQMCWEE